MKQINTLPIELYLEKARIANKSGQKTLVLDIKEAVALSDSLAVVMTRLTGQLEDLIAQSQRTQPQEEVIQVSMDGGGFR
jgi:ribosomal silencing factor RsfS